MKPKFQLLSFLSIALLAPSLQAGTVTTTFSFQQGDVRKDGAVYVNGPFDGATYAGVVDGRVTDNSATSAISTTATATLGNQFRTGSPNGQQHCGLFSYDLTELNTFITDNTGPFSSVTIQSVSFKLISAGGVSGGFMTLNLHRTDPFTASDCTWSNYTTATPWTVPYQSLTPPNDAVAYGFTGGPSALTTNLGGTSPGSTVTSGNALTWTSSANFISALTDALARTDKTLYLTARGSFFNNGDNRLNVNFSPAAIVDDRPELLVTLDVITTAAPATWTGATDNSWITATNWSPSGVPATDAPIIFDNLSTANLNTVLNQDFTVTSVTVSNPSGAVSISGANSLNLGAGGFDLSAATQDLTVSSPVVLGATQSWNVANGRTLGVSGTISGNFPLTIAGTGKVSLGASSILPNGVSSGNLIVDGTLDLNGTSQSVNGLNGVGNIDNTAVGSCSLTIGNNDAAGTFSGTIQDTGGALAVLKTGSGNLTLSGANGFSGGFTNNGTGQVFSQNSSALGTGSVIMNGSTLYATTGSYTFANALTLNAATLRQGGGNNRLLTWSGPVGVPASSTLQSDGGTAGITISGDVTLSSGATLASSSGGTAHTISGALGGTGSLTVNSGTLVLNGAGSYSGNTQINAGTLLLGANGTIPSSSNLTINGSGNFPVRNTGGWTYNGTITGDGTGQINLNTGTNATLAGPISGVVNINANSAGTDTTISGAISGATNVTVQGTVDINGLGAILRLGGANSYSGTTTVSRGSLVLAASNVLPDTTAVSIGNATLDAATFTDTAGTLDVTNTATINLGTGATLAFADSSAVDWTDIPGTLNITGTFVPGNGVDPGVGVNPGSLRFGDGTGTGLTPTQLAGITASGWSGFALDAYGFLTATAAGSPYDTWKTQITNGLNLRTDDADGDGFNNLQEFLFGTSPIAGNGSLVTTTASGGNLVLRWLQRESGATYTLKQSATLAANSWTPVGSPTPAQDGDQTGAPTDYKYYTVTLPTSGGKLFFRIEGLEN